MHILINFIGETMHMFKLIGRFITLLVVLSLSSGVFAATNSDDPSSTHHRGHHERMDKSKATDPQGKIDINTADAKSLTLLKGIGEKRAEAIIKYRDANGPFKSVEELDKVKGISKKVIDDNRDHLTVS